MHFRPKLHLTILYERKNERWKTQHTDSFKSSDGGENNKGGSKLSVFMLEGWTGSTGMSSIQVTVCT